MATLISSPSLSAGAFEATGLDLSPYKLVDIVATNLTCGTSQWQSRLTVFTSGGEITADYDTAGGAMSSSGAAGADGGLATAFAHLSDIGTFGNSNTAGEVSGYRVRFVRPSIAAGFKLFFLEGAQDFSSASYGYTLGATHVEIAEAITGFKVYGSAALLGGTVKIVGL